MNCDCFNFIFPIAVMLFILAAVIGTLPGSQFERDLVRKFKEEKANHHKKSSKMINELKGE